MRPGRLPDRRRAELERLQELDDAVGRLHEQWRTRGRADAEWEVVAAAARALLGVVRRFEGAELRLLVDPEQGIAVRVAEEDGRPVAELDGPPAAVAGPAMSTLRAPSAPPAPFTPPAPSTGPAPSTLPAPDSGSDRLRLPAPRDPGTSESTGTPPPGKAPDRFLRADVTREIAARRAARRSGEA